MSGLDPGNYVFLATREDMDGWDNPALTKSDWQVPMSLQLYLTFIAACVGLALLPGPIVTLVIANGLRHGTRAALINIAGAQAGVWVGVWMFAVRAASRV